MQPLFSLIKTRVKSVFLNKSCIWWTDRLNAHQKLKPHFFRCYNSEQARRRVNRSDPSNSLILSSTYWMQYCFVGVGSFLCRRMYTQTEQLCNSSWLMIVWNRKQSLRRGFVIWVSVFRANALQQFVSRYFFKPNLLLFSKCYYHFKNCYFGHGKTQKYVTIN